jgi:hypothetical protein
MSDYCDCGSLANARCRCGTTVCSLHTQHPQPYHSNALMIAARTHEGHPEHSLFAALNNAWSTVPNTMCGSCYARTIDEVAARYAPAFRDHSDAKAETIASVLLRNESWTTGRENHATETIGQKTLRTAGYRVPWSHPDPLDTAARLYASSHGEPPETSIRMKLYTERTKMFGGTERVESVISLGSIRAWPITAKYTDNNGYPASVTVLVGAMGTHKESQISDPVDGQFFYAAEDVAKAKRTLEGAFQPLPAPDHFFTKQQALAAALTNGF